MITKRPDKPSCRVSIIDDDDLSRQMMSDLLKAAGCVVLPLSSPIGASRELMATDAHVVVVDVMMPSMRGDKLARLLRRNPRLSRLGIVLVTSLPQGKVASLGISEPNVVVLSKSELDTQLVPAVEGVCRSGCASST